MLSLHRPAEAAVNHGRRQPTLKDSAGSSSRDQPQGKRLLPFLNPRTVRQLYLWLKLILISKQVQRNPHS